MNFEDDWRNKLVEDQDKLENKKDVEFKISLYTKDIGKIEEQINCIVSDSKKNLIEYDVMETTDDFC